MKVDHGEVRQLMISIIQDCNYADAITHTDVFHADEVFATVILSRIIPDLKVCRVRKVPANLRRQAIIYDIGESQYDHHQPEGGGVRENQVPYAAAGLIWRKFGHFVCEKSPAPSMVWELIDKTLLQGIDAFDNGVIPAAKYQAHHMTVSNIIASFYPPWDCGSARVPREIEDEAFLKSVIFADIVFENVYQGACAKARAKVCVESAISISDGVILDLPQYMPWHDFIFGAPHGSKAARFKYVVFPSDRSGYCWRVISNRGYPAPSSWRGLQADALREITGIETAMFVHPGGHIGGARTKGDTMAMVKLIHSYAGFSKVQISSDAGIS